MGPPSTYNFNPNPPPSGDPATAACRIDAAIDCLILDEKGFPLRECDDQRDPRTFVCNDDLSATGLAFRYLGDYGDRVIVEVGGGRTAAVFRNYVSTGQVFRADGDFRGEAEIKVFRVNSDGSTGESEGPFYVDTECETDSTLLTLSTTFGPFELVGFDNAVGFSTSIVDMKVNYYVGNNDLANGMYVAWANVTSPLEMEPRNVVSQEFFLGKNDEPLFFPINIELFTLVHTETLTSVDLVQMFRDGESLTFEMEAGGRARVSQLPCSERTTCKLDF